MAMKTRNPLEPCSLSFSRRYFNLKHSTHDDDDDTEVPLSCKRSSHSFSGFSEKQHKVAVTSFIVVDPPRKKKLPKLKSLFAKTPWTRGRPTKLTGTLFGHRRGHVRIAFQETPQSPPSFLIEIPTATGSLVKKLASGAVRVALECEKRRRAPKLLEEPHWRAYCNGSKCGPATRRECGPHELRVLEAVGPVTMGAGVLPDDGEEGEMMYMRAVFERVAGSTKDSESFYMISPDGSGGPELTLFFRRV